MRPVSVARKLKGGNFGMETTESNTKKAELLELSLLFHGKEVAI